MLLEVFVWFDWLSLPQAVIAMWHSIRSLWQSVQIFISKINLGIFFVESCWLCLCFQAVAWFWYTQACLFGILWWLIIVAFCTAPPFTSCFVHFAGFLISNDYRSSRIGETASSGAWENIRWWCLGCFWAPYQILPPNACVFKIVRRT